MTLSYFMPTEVLVGKGIVKEKAQLLSKFGSKALIVTGRNSAKINGALNDVLEALKQEAIEAVVFDQIEENPSLETIAVAAHFGRAENVDFVIGIGGGSPLDASKAIAIMIPNEQLTIDTLITTDVLNGLDVVTIPTTSGTGSETTQYAILTDHKMKTKRNLGQRIFPRLSLLDPTYTMFMSNYTTLVTAVDALSHLMESYLSTKSNIMSEMLVEGGLKLWGECIESLQNKVFTYEVREKLMIASTIAGMAIANTGTSLPHGMGYYLTYYKGVPHGYANGVLYRGYLSLFNHTEKIDRIVKFLGVAHVKELIAIVEELVDVTISVTEEEMVEWTEDMMENEAKLANHPDQVTKEQIYEVFKKSLLSDKIKN
ncbi:MAG: iron-containing alcohol dehydrogenase family protein [Cellulosilyticaceae bacterium]